MTSRKTPPVYTGGPQPVRSGQGHNGQPDHVPQPPARPSAPRHDPAFAPQRPVTARDGKRLLSSFPVPVTPVEPPVVPCLGTVGGDAETAARNLSTLSAALGLLAHSETGYDLMSRLAAAGYRVVFDDARTQARGAAGLCDPHNRTVVLKSSHDRDALALLLAHEAVHALQNARADDLLPSARHKPEVMIRLSFAIEADAYAQQVQVAFELARTQVAQRPLLLMRTRFPALVRAGDRLLQDCAARDHDHGRAAMADGRLVAGLFDAFYDDVSLRSYYERAHVDFMTDFAARRRLDHQHGTGQGKARPFNVAASGGGDLFRLDMSNARLKNLLLWRGQPYVKAQRPTLDFNAPRYAGLSAPTCRAVEDFYATYLPLRKKPDLPVFGLYVPDKAADAPVAPSDARGRQTGSTIRAPRKRKRDFW